MAENESAQPAQDAPQAGHGAGSADGGADGAGPPTAQPGGSGGQQATADDLTDPAKVGRLWTGTPVVPAAVGARKGMAPSHLVKHLWRPGQSGGGHEHQVPSYRTLMRRRLKQLAAELGKKGLGPEDEEMLIAEAHLTMILQDRSVPALKEWLDREHGPVVQKVEQNLNVQDVTRAEFDAFMISPRDAELVEGGAPVDGAPPDAELHDDSPQHDPADLAQGR